MSTKQIETNKVNGYRLAEQGPSSAGVFDRGTFGIIMQILSLVSKGSGLARKIRLSWSAIYYVNIRLEVIETAC